MFEQHGIGWGLFFLGFAAMIGAGTAGAPLKKGGAPQGSFEWRAGLLGAALGAAGAWIGCSVALNQTIGFVIGSLVGGLIGGIARRS